MSHTLWSQKTGGLVFQKTQLELAKFQGNNICSKISYPPVFPPDLATPRNASYNCVKLFLKVQASTFRGVVPATLQ